MRWPRFGLRTLILAVVILGIGMAGLRGRGAAMGIYCFAVPFLAVLRYREAAYPTGGPALAATWRRAARLLILAIAAGVMLGVPVILGFVVYVVCMSFELGTNHAN